MGGFNDGSWGKKDENGVISGLDAEGDTLHVAIERLRRATDDENADGEWGDKKRLARATRFSSCSWRAVRTSTRSTATARRRCITPSRMTSSTSSSYAFKGASLHVGGKFIGTGNTTLHYAVRLGDPQMVARILARRRMRILTSTRTAREVGHLWAWPFGRKQPSSTLSSPPAHERRVLGTGKTHSLARVNNKLAIIETIEKNQKSA